MAQGTLMEFLANADDDTVIDHQLLVSSSFYGDIVQLT
jgi:hypothetical protein